MRYNPINHQLFIQNRINFCKQILANSLAIFHSNDVMPTNADGAMGFVQNADLYYLTGIDQEETILILFPDAPEEKWKEILFIKETNEHIAIWEGNKLTKEQAREVSGIQTIYWTKDFDSILHSVVFEAENIYLATNEHARNSSQVQSANDRALLKYKSQFPLHQYYRASPILQNLRAIKSEIEITQIQTACNITEKAFREILGFVKPGVWEFEIEALFMSEILKNRSRRPAYLPIVATGANACVLHYIENNAQCQSGDLLLLDLGAEYANYHSDMTRTIPVNGKFTPRQKAVYEAVLRVLKQASQWLVVGNTLQEYHQNVGKIMEEELIGLGLLNKEEVKNQNPASPLYKKYFMHGTSHFLGLDTHDVGSRYRKFEAGMVFTCEPGIYIREESIGIRLENNYLITNDKPINLMANIPIEVEEIESLMNK